MYRDNGQFLVAYDQNKPDGLTRTNPWRRETQNRSYTKPRHDQDWIGYQINGEKTKNKKQKQNNSKMCPKKLAKSNPV